jgi:ATP-dependent exoDNAse (exonuclease V) alpha subunit
MNSDSFEVSGERQDCLYLLNQTKQNLFITGKAGTGKSTLVAYFRNQAKKNTVLVAPTGIAALNIRGQTIHSFFKFPPRLINRSSIKKLAYRKLYQDLECLVIDEVSMVRADMLDNIDRFLRLNGPDKNKPFGGVQIILVGDLYQLPPVVTNEENEIMSMMYETPYFFSAEAYKQNNFEMIELKTIYRQKEEVFIGILNQIRTGGADEDLLEQINSRFGTEFMTDKHIYLCTTNMSANSINLNRLAQISGPVYKFKAKVEDNFPTEERNLPVELVLNLKTGARVLFVKNDKNGQWVNGSLGAVAKVDEDRIFVRLDDNDEVVEVTKEYWENVRYEYNSDTGEIGTSTLGKLYQYPLKLAWAITIHKSQGMTFDKVCLDFSRSPFAHGQTYVALSRCKKLSGLVLTRKITPADILIDEQVVEFSRVNG